MPIIRPWPRISTTPLHAGQRLAQHRRDQRSPTAAALCHQAVLLHDVQRGQRRRAGQRIAAEGGAVVARARTVPAALPRGQAGADRHARAQALGQRHHVGLDAGLLVGEPFAGAADAALHFVAASAASPARRTAGAAAAGNRCRSEIDAAFALDGLQQHGHHVRDCARRPASIASRSS